MRTKFTIAGLGGTFDRLHDGHKGFLKYAAQVADYLIIGVALEELSRHKDYPELIQAWHVRVKEVKRFCQDNHIAFEIIELTNPYGPTIEPDTRIEAIVVTEETEKGADKINEIREGMSLKPLPVYVYSMQKDERGQTISSSNIRAGVISRTGVYYAGIAGDGLTLTKAQRDFFSRLQGKLVKAPTVRSDRVCVVGDTTLEKFLSFKWDYDLAVFDKKSLRAEYVSPLIERLQIDRTVANTAGEISTELVKVLQNWNRDGYRHLLVEGEEDLATVALVLTLPLESVVYFGQPNQGLVELVVTEKVKNQFYAVLASQEK